MGPWIIGYALARTHLQQARFMVHLAAFLRGQPEEANALAVACEELVEADAARAAARRARQAWTEAAS